MPSLRLRVLSAQCLLEEMIVKRSLRHGQQLWVGPGRLRVVVVMEGLVVHVGVPAVVVGVVRMPRRLVLVLVLVLLHHHGAKWRARAVGERRWRGGHSCCRCWLVGVRV
jgi:hypothetical protein